MNTTVPHRTEAQAHRVEPVRLSAGPLTACFDDGSLRCVRFGEREVLRRIYGAVRDRNWGTIPGVLRDLQVDLAESAFGIRYVCEHRQGLIHFVWHGELSGEADGTIRVTFEGEAMTTFLSNRIGLCVLHPIRECAGALCRTLHSDATTQERRFPQRVAAEQPIPGFTNLVGLSHEIAPGYWLDARLEGDLFETEDQRNWIDASYKTYSTPLRLPFPVEIKAGTHIRQCVTLRLRTQGPSIPARPVSYDASQPIQIRLAHGGPSRVPEIGLGMASHGESLSNVEAQRLLRLGVSHLRVDLRLADAQWPNRLRAAARDGMDLGAALELALHLPGTGPGDLSGVAREISRLKVDLTRAMVFRDGQRSTLEADLESARFALADFGLAMGVGTDSDLYQLQLQPPPGGGDFLCWSMNPQVHASDDRSIAETPEGVVHQLVTMRERYPDLPQVVSPITLKPRFNPVATAPMDDSNVGELPPEVDVRQMSLFAAAWTLAMLKALAEGGAESVTFFETTGWRGIMETASGSPMPEWFPSTPGCVFPVYHVLADLGEFARSHAIPTECDRPGNVESLLLQQGRNLRWIIANLSGESRRVRLPDNIHIGRIRRLDESTVSTAMNRPEVFRSERSTFEGPELVLGRHAVATLDFTCD